MLLSDKLENILCDLRRVQELAATAVRDVDKFRGELIRQEDAAKEEAQCE